MGLEPREAYPASRKQKNNLGGIAAEARGNVVQVGVITEIDVDFDDKGLPVVDTRRREPGGKDEPPHVNEGPLGSTGGLEQEIKQRLEALARPSGSQSSASPVRRSMLLSAAAWLMPGQEREGWLEENRAYLTDIEGRLGRIVWVLSQLVALPRLSYTFRADAKKESA